MEKIVIVGPESAVTAVPRILGFVPERSLVILWIVEATVVLCQRADLPGDADTPWSRSIIDSARHVRPTACVDVWVDSLPPDPETMAQLHGELKRRGIGRIATLATDGCTWLCEDEAMAPRPLPETLIWDGARRGDFQVNPRSGTLIRRATPMGQDDAVDGAITEIIRDTESESTWTSSSARRAVRALQDVRVRDALLWHMGSQPGLTSPLARRLVALLHCTAPTATGEVAITCAMAFWLAGDGYRSSVVLERALRDEPGHVLGQLLDAAIRAGLPPGAWRERLRDTPYEVCRRGPDCFERGNLYSLDPGQESQRQAPAS